MEEGVTSNMLKCVDDSKRFRNIKESGEKKYQMTLGGLKNASRYLILGNVNAYRQGMEIPSGIVK